MTRIELRRWARPGPLPWLAGLLAAYLALPLVALAAHLGQRGGLRAPGLGPALWVSLLTATISAAVCAVLGVPLAHVLARSRRRAIKALGVVVMLPLALPPLMSGVLLVSLVGPTTVLGRAFGGHLTDSVVGIVLAQVFVSAPFVVVAARSAFGAIDPGILDAAATLGWGELQRFWRVSLRLAGPAIAAGLTLAWLRAFGEFGATVILAYHPYSLPVLTYVQFGASGVTDAMATSGVALVAAIAVLGLLQLGRAHPRRGTRRAIASRPAGLERVEDRDGRATRIESLGAERRPASPIEFDIDQRSGSFDLKVAYRSSTPHVALIGPSGAGKSMTLRAIAGVSHSGSASVRIGSRDLTNVPTERRNVGYMPQEPSLLPSQNVWQQVLAGRDAEPRTASRWLAQLKITGLESRLPHELSGGQRRRVALARALCRSPRLLLLDEPLSGLDTPVRDQLRRELREVLQRSGIPSVVVTHDPEEAAMLAEEIIVMEEGRASQSGLRSDVFSRPASPSVAALLGIENIRLGTMRSRDLVDAGGAMIEVDATSIPPGSPIYWCVRPERLTVEVGPWPEGNACHRGSVDDVIDLGREIEIAVTLGDGLALWARSARSRDVRPGARCAVRIPPDEVMVWPAVPVVDREPALR